MTIEVSKAVFGVVTTQSGQGVNVSKAVFGVVFNPNEEPPPEPSPSARRRQIISR